MASDKEQINITKLEAMLNKGIKRYNRALAKLGGTVK